MKQVMKYSDRCGADEAHLIIFDRRPEVPWDEKIFCEKRELEDCRERNGVSVVIWGM